MAAVEPIDELKECLRASVEMLLDKLNDRLHEDMDGVDYLCVQLVRIQNLVERASGLYDIPLEIVDILRSAQVFSYSPRYAAIILRLSVFFGENWANFWCI